MLGAAAGGRGPGALVLGGRRMARSPEGQTGCCVRAWGLPRAAITTQESLAPEAGKPSQYPLTRKRSPPGSCQTPTK